MATSKIFSNPQRNLEVNSKRRRLSEESDDEQYEKYQPTTFLRCHCFKNDPYDSGTQIWEAAFEPRIGKNSSQTNIVATCGGNIVCLIDCSTATVLKRYTDSNRLENFYCMAWTVICVEDQKHVSILAVAGKEKHIVLLHPEKLICYSRTRAHEKDINTLLFHPREPTRLFSAGYDKCINVWDIGKPTGHSTSIKRLLRIETNNFLLQLTYSIRYDTMLAAGENGLTIWSNVAELKTPSVIGHMTFPKSKIIDGLAIFPEEDEFAVVKQSKSGAMEVFNLGRVVEELNKEQVKKNYIKGIQFKSCFQLAYCDTVHDYMYLTLQKNLLVCGDDKGRLWVYDTRKIPFESEYNAETKIRPDVVLKWPSISNPVHKHKKVVDEQKPVVINAVAVSPDLSYIVAATNINLVCLWERKPS